MAIVSGVKRGGSDLGAWHPFYIRFHVKEMMVKDSIVLFVMAEKEGFELLALSGFPTGRRTEGTTIGR